MKPQRTMKPQLNPRKQRKIDLNRSLVPNCMACLGRGSICLPCTDTGCASCIDMNTYTWVHAATCVPCRGSGLDYKLYQEQLLRNKSALERKRATIAQRLNSEDAAMAHVSRTPLRFTY